MTPEQRKCIDRLLLDVFNNDVVAARQWMRTPNAYFFNETPMRVCERGEHKSVIELLENRVGKH